MGFFTNKKDINNSIYPLGVLWTLNKYICAAAGMVPSCKWTGDNAVEGPLPGSRTGYTYRAATEEV